MTTNPQRLTCGTFLSVAAFLCGTAIGLADDFIINTRTAINIPDIAGYLTLKCDLHMHTVFSDGLVWPSVRAVEAWREGLDAIAITDHIERQPHRAEGLTTNHNRSFEIARDAGKDLDLLVIKGAEITRAMPPGHFNALFLTNSTPLAVSRWEDAVRNAHAQGAFICWNHPGWERQITNGQVLWYPEHTRLLEQGMLHGIEVLNARDYYPEAHRWAVERKLALLTGSDIHPPLTLDDHLHYRDHRPVTLVFARARTVEALREALFQRRTAIYAGNQLIGDEQFLRPIYEQSVRLNRTGLALKGRQRAYVQISNSSDIDYELERAGELPEIATPRKVRLAARRTVLFEVQSRNSEAVGSKALKPPYRVTNLLIRPGQPMQITLPLEITFAPSSSTAR